MVDTAPYKSDEQGPLLGRRRYDPGLTRYIYMHLYTERYFKSSLSFVFVVKRSISHLLKSLMLSKNTFSADIIPNALSLSTLINIKKHLSALDV